MNIEAKWECQSCYRTFATEDEAIQCHGPREIFVCGHCNMDYDDSDSAELCGTEESGGKTKLKWFEDLD